MQQAPPQYSPDGRWWWTGQRWVPAEPDPWLAPSAYRSPAAQGEGTAQRYAPVWAPPARPRRRTPAAFWIAIAGIVLLLLIALGGAAGTWFGRQVPRTGTAPGIDAPAPVTSPPPASPAAPAPRSGSADQYRRLVMVDAARFQDAARAVSDRCGAGLASGVAACRSALQATDDAVQRFQSDLDANPAPACVSAADGELRSALALYHQGLQQAVRGLDRSDVTLVLQGVDLMGQGGAHVRSASSLLPAAC